jgi:hypothetical protein
MEKEIVIHFLNEHWDELTSFVSETLDGANEHTLMERLPTDFCEFIQLLSKIAALQQQAVEKQKGLLEKAQQLRKHDALHAGEEYSSIVVKNGLFTVQPLQTAEILDVSFKTLVDSVLSQKQ